ncbi:MAG: hypothetical protein JO345_12280 [Streptosporangiaceae bacterium]|nr:hypothetical protein [Streptosporangiaceae bacterium]
MDVLKVFRERGKHLAWQRLDDDQVVGPASGTEIGVDQGYFIIRLSEVYLARSRTLWRKFYPVVHAWGATVTGQEHGLAAPTQLQQISGAGLDRVVTVNTRLIGPTPYRGGDVSLVAGLYAVPGDDAAQALVATISALTTLTGSAIPAGTIAKVVTDGVDKLLGLDKTTLRLGICDTFYPGNLLRTGFHVGLGADLAEVDFSRLWLRDGHLMKGPDPFAAKPYQDHDYVVVEVERREVREDWPGLPGMAKLQEQLEGIMKLAKATVAQKREKLAAVWPEVVQTLTSSPHLTTANAYFIAANIAADLKERLNAMEFDNPFEARSWSGDTQDPDPANIDLAALPDYYEFSEMSNVSEADMTAANLWA